MSLILNAQSAFSVWAAATVKILRVASHLMTLTMTMTMLWDAAARTVIRGFALADLIRVTDLQDSAFWQDFKFTS
jgi:hypothetical protein